MKLENVFLVKNQLRNFNKIKVGFLEYFIDNSWIKEFDEKDKKRIKSAKKQTEKAKRILKRFGNKIDILICHQPLYGYLDKVKAKYAPKDWQGKHAGSKVILDYIRKYQPKYVFCGHIHEGEGKAKISKTEIYNLGVASYRVVEL
ncbi:metallophosphoesterase [Candidatus Pacearchaeota archaeon]|nr:metallophosphoesterase [Candidatus Pacearchaeota archaeon]